MKRSLGASAEVPTVDVELSEDQRTRLLCALAEFDAKVAAIRRGMSLAEVQAKTWTVNVDPMES